MVSTSISATSVLHGSVTPPRRYRRPLRPPARRPRPLPRAQPRRGGLGSRRRPRLAAGLCQDNQSSAASLHASCHPQHARREQLTIGSRCAGQLRNAHRRQVFLKGQVDKTIGASPRSTSSPACSRASGRNWWAAFSGCASRALHRSPPVGAAVLPLDQPRAGAGLVHPQRQRGQDANCFDTSRSRPAGDPGRAPGSSGDQDVHILLIELDPPFRQRHALALHQGQNRQQQRVGRQSAHARVARHRVQQFCFLPLRSGWAMVASRGAPLNGRRPFLHKRA